MEASQYFTAEERNLIERDKALCKEAGKFGKQTEQSLVNL